MSFAGYNLEVRFLVPYPSSSLALFSYSQESVFLKNSIVALKLIALELVALELVALELVSLQMVALRSTVVALVALELARLGHNRLASKHI